MVSNGWLLGGGCLLPSWPTLLARISQLDTRCFWKVNMEIVRVSYQENDLVPGTCDRTSRNQVLKRKVSRPRQHT